jgi:hypothetical protein
MKEHKMRKLSALFILIVVSIPLTVSALTLTSIRPWVLDRGFYEGIVSDERLYETMLVNDLPNQFNRTAITAVEALPLDALGSALQEVVTVEYQRGQALYIIDTVFDYIEGRADDFELVIDIQPVKTAILGEGRSRFAATLAAALPDCEAGQTPIAAGGKLTRCIAADSSVEAAAAQIAAALPAALENTPDQLIINDGDFFIRMNWYSSNWFARIGIFAALDLAILTIVVMALGAALATGVLGGSNLRETLQWFSAALLLPGALFLVMGLALTMPIIVGPISNSVVALRYSEAYRAGLVDLIVQIIQQLGSGFAVSGAVTSLIALGLLILGRATPADDQQKTKMVQVPVRES